MEINLISLLSFMLKRSINRVYRLTCFAFLLIPTLSIANESSILIVESSSSNIYQTFSKKITSKLEYLCSNRCPEYSIDTTTVDSLETTDTASYSVILTLGSKAAKSIEEVEGAQKVLHAVVPASFYKDNKHKSHKLLLLDQPIDRQLIILDELIGENKTIGVLYSDKTTEINDKIIKSVEKNNLSFKTYYIDSKEKIGEKLKEIFNEIDAILIIPDKDIYNRISLKEILLTGYFNKTPFIGYSKAIAKAGALASIYTDKENISHDTATLVVKLLDGKTIPDASYPSEYKLIINKQIQDSIQYSIPQSILNKSSTEVIQ